MIPNRSIHFGRLCFVLIRVSAITTRHVETIFPAAHRLVSGRAQDRWLSGHRAADDDGKLFPAVAERGHHSARRASRRRGTDPSGICWHCPRRRIWFVARCNPHVLGGADCRTAARFALWKIRFVPAGKTGEGRALDGALRRNGRVYRPPIAGRTAARRHSRRHRADGLPENFPSLRCSARGSGAPCSVMSASRRARTRNSCTANCITSRSGSVARWFFWADSIISSSTGR